MGSSPIRPARAWITRAVLGIVLATFFSDFSHEMATAVLPLYLASVGLGPAALGLIEGAADLVICLAKLFGGVVGHHLRAKRALASLGYLVTTLGTAGMGLVASVVALVGLRGAAWFGRGFRSPLRDHLLAEAVERSHYGRAYGLERAGDMLGAVSGPLVATLLLGLALDFRTVILWSALPGLAAAAAMFFLTRGTERGARAELPVATAIRPRFPRAFWSFLCGVGLFGLGDFSRTFLIWMAARALGDGTIGAGGAMSSAVLLYALHNLVAALSAYPIGKLGDRGSKLSVLLAGYGLGVLTNLVLALRGGSLPWLIAAIVLSGVYISIEETLEKAVAAELLPRELRSLGFGLLAGANAAGDMLSSLCVGLLLERGEPGWALGSAAFCGAAGVGWLAFARRRSGVLA